jgi:hypothetical protein
MKPMPPAKLFPSLVLLFSGQLFGAGTALKCSVDSGISCNQFDFGGSKHLVCKEHQPVVSRTYYLVDEDTYRGWQTYETFCAFCHEKDARGPKGSDGAPLSQTKDDKVNCRPHNLLVASELTKFAYFKGRLDTGYPRNDEECLSNESKKPGEKDKIWTLRMPRWSNVALVKRNYSNIYGYLMLMRENRLPYDRKERLHRLNKSDSQSLNCPGK